VPLFCLMNITRVQISCLAKSATLKTLEMPKL
jgi:hypothetical protein